MSPVNLEVDGDLEVIRVLVRGPKGVMAAVPKAVDHEYLGPLKFTPEVREIFANLLKGKGKTQVGILLRALLESENSPAPARLHSAAVTLSDLLRRSGVRSSQLVLSVVHEDGRSQVWVRCPRESAAEE